jgi:hypothetical protein
MGHPTVLKTNPVNMCVLKVQPSLGSDLLPWLLGSVTQPTKVKPLQLLKYFICFRSILISFA